MMSNWDFRKLAKREQDFKIDPFEEIVKNVREEMPHTTTFTRESNQNSLNQPINKNINVDVKITIITLSGEHKSNFLKAMHWDTLKKHLQACADDKAKTTKQLSQGIKQIDSVGSLNLLKVEDFNSRGLTGADDFDTMDDDFENNFLGLFRSQGATQFKEKYARRGGSYGVGKNILWAFSSIGTVLGSSIVQTPQNSKSDQTRYYKKCHSDGALRLFGSAKMISHWIGKNRYDWVGEFGNIDGDGGASSVWDDHKLVEQLHLSRKKIDEGGGYGTSLLVVGFKDPENKDHVPVKSFRYIREATAKYFWPAMRKENNGIRISFASQEIGRKPIGAKIELKDFDPFIKALEEKTTHKIADKPGMVAKKEFSFKIPATIPNKQSGKHKEQSVTAELRLYRTDEKSARHDKNANRIALIRGFGMVVDYWSPDLDEDDDLTFYGVLKVGLALDKENDHNKNAEMFFKATEPPLHDKWTSHHTAKFLTDYVKPKKYLDDFYTKLRETCKDLCGVAESKTDEECKLLADLYPFGKKIAVQKPRTRLLNMNGKQILNGEKWEISGTAQIQREPDKKGKEWETEISFHISQEENRSDLRIPFDTAGFTVKNDDGVTFEIDKENDMDVKVKIDALEQFDFTAILDTTRCSGLNELRATTQLDKRHLAIGYRIRLL